jgi:glutathione S-transferase
MKNITITGFRSIPPFAMGLVRDLRIRWALEEAGFAYDHHPIEVEARNAPENRAFHPFGMVPAFEGDGRRLFETGAILLRLAQDSEALAPTDRDGREQMTAWMFAALNSVEPAVQNVGTLDTLLAGEPWAAQARPTMVQMAEYRLGQLADWLESREYLTGRFTVADILMATVLRILRHTDIVAGFPSLAAYLARCEARPAFQKALADQIAGYAAAEAA